MCVPIKYVNPWYVPPAAYSIPLLGLSNVSRIRNKLIKCKESLRLTKREITVQQLQFSQQLSLS
uniref:Uncharacterized protein n=1 Tax=Arundo donax TaxID=35708 RepID=A0A0A9A742_ARUDO